jgi:hypothetical protein
MIADGNLEERVAAELMPHLILMVNTTCTRDYERAMLVVLDQLRASGLFAHELAVRVTRDAAVSFMQSSRVGALPVITSVTEDESLGHVCGQGLASCYGCPKQGFHMREGMLKRII